MRLTVVGSGDAFGSGGRLQSCYHVALGARAFLVDCGASAMIGLDRLGLAANDIDTILISHLHGDHYAGLVWFLMHAQYVAKRTTPLTIVGPPSIEARYRATAEALFPGTTTVKKRFDVDFVEITAGAPLDLAIGRLTAYEVSHPSGAPSHALRFESGSQVLAFTGDTEWVEALVACGQGADLYLVECYAFDQPVRYHMSWQTIAANLPRIGARKVILTHMSTPMLANRDKAVGTPGILLAEDGLVIDI